MGRTYDEILTELKQYAKQQWPDWNVEARHIGNIILECLADQIEKVEYRADHQENELFPDTATEYRSILLWARMTGYPVQSVRPAKTYITASITKPATAKIHIPEGSRIITPGQRQIAFETTEPANMLPGESKVNISVRQTESKQDTFTGSGEAFQVYETEYGPVWADSIIVKIDGIAWTKVNDFLLSRPADQHYVIELQEDGKVLIMFGDGAKGKAPPNDSEIVVEYKVSQGAEGEVPTNTLTVLDSVIYDSDGWIVDLKVRNPEPAIDGQNQEDINHIKDNLPGWISSSDACITSDDFTNAAQRVLGVKRVLTLTHEQDPSIPKLTYILYVVPETGGEPSLELLEAVKHEVTVERPRIATTVVDVKAAKYETVNISCLITRTPGYKSTDTEKDEELKTVMRTRVIENIKQYFDYSRKDGGGTWAIDFGKPVYLAKLTAWVAGLPGIANVVFSSPSSDILPAMDTIPALGSVIVDVT